jgi:hypothetical protein
MVAASRPRIISAMGMTVGPPPGWEATIYRRHSDPGGQTYPVMHAATVALPADRGDYGSGLVELLGPDDVFVSVLDFGPAAASTRLFESLGGIPGLTPDAFRSRQLQRTIRGQAGVQRFFNTKGRGFCLYSVIGSLTNRVPLTSRANELIGSLRIEPVVTEP